MLQPIPITIANHEIRGSPVETLADDQITVTRTLHCSWADRLTLARQLLGGWINGQYFLPHPCPSLPAARVDQVHVKPMEPASILASSTAGLAAYHDAVLEVRYRPPPQLEHEGRWISETLEPIDEAAPLDGDRLYWLPASEPHQGPPIGDASAPVRLMRGFNWAVTHYHITALPIQTLTLIGHVNQAVLLSPSLGLTFPPRTLLYQPPTIRRIPTPENHPLWNATFRFTYRSGGWDQVFDPARQQAHPVYARHAEQPLTLYPDGDFLQLWSQ